MHGKSQWREKSFKSTQRSSDRKDTKGKIRMPMWSRKSRVNPTRFFRRDQDSAPNRHPGQGSKIGA